MPLFVKCFWYKKTKKTDLNSRGRLKSNAWKSSYIFARSWFMQEPDEKKSDLVSPLTGSNKFYRRLFS